MIALTAILVATAVASTSAWALPKLMISGYLYNPDGSPASPGGITVTVRLRAAAGDPDYFWQHTAQTLLIGTSGYFEVLLDSAQAGTYNHGFGGGTQLLDGLTTLIDNISNAEPVFELSIPAPFSVVANTPVPMNAYSLLALKAAEARSLSSRIIPMTTVSRLVTSNPTPPNKVLECVTLAASIPVPAVSVDADCVVRPPRNSLAPWWNGWSWSCELNGSPAMTASIRICGHNNVDPPCAAAAETEPTSCGSIPDPHPRLIVPADWSVRIIE